jgi:hypothetical protein
VQRGDWVLEIQDSIGNIPRYKFCKMRWEEYIPWADTGIYDYMMVKIEKHGSVDGCYHLNDIIVRFKKLVTLFNHIEKTRTFRTQKELDPSVFNKNRGLLFHIGRDNKLIFGAGGMHRFSIAKILKLENVSAQLGLLQPEALPVWKEHKVKSY